MLRFRRMWVWLRPWTPTDDPNHDPPPTAPDTGTDKAPRPVDQRIERLSTASLKRIVEPDTEVPGAVGDGQVLPDELLTLPTSPSSSTS